MQTAIFVEICVFLVDVRVIYSVGLTFRLSCADFSNYRDDLEVVYPFISTFLGSQIGFPVSNFCTNSSKAIKHQNYFVPGGTICVIWLDIEHRICLMVSSTLIDGNGNYVIDAFHVTAPLLKKENSENKKKVSLRHLAVLVDKRVATIFKLHIKNATQTKICIAERVPNNWILEDRVSELQNYLETEIPVFPFILRGSGTLCFSEKINLIISKSRRC
ncbi:hypothetical protein DGG96_16715 [Legionella qingyii]|uniref:Uncharacterized protein n=1 Tax=Legionella qingyii TaxID=2184757 RepID=A0A317TZS7_9GAMM|nr:hypothetical protein DGG96_16715 [Legionella qingyii]